MFWRVVLLLFVSYCITLVQPYFTVTIHPEFVAQNGHSHFEANRWNGHNGMDGTSTFAKNKAIGTRPGRWVNSDLRDGTFQQVPEDPHRKGYPDPKHFTTHEFEFKVGEWYKQNLNAYGPELAHDLVMTFQANHYKEELYKSVSRYTSKWTEYVVYGPL